MLYVGGEISVGDDRGEGLLEKRCQVSRVIADAAVY